MREYHAINLLIWLAVVLLLLSVQLDWIPVHCVYADIGATCKTCGLTRALQAGLNGNFTGIPTAFRMLFLLLGGQLVFRPLVSLLLHSIQKLKLIRNVDVTVAVGLLIVFLDMV